MNNLHISFLILFLFLLSSCTHVPPANDRYVNLIVEEKIGMNVQWIQEKSEEEAVQSCIQEFLSQDLTLDHAVQIALLNNPKIQAAFEDIGIARADLIQAGLLSNPFLEGVIRFPLQKNATTNIDLLAIQNFLDVLLIPLRKKIAEAEFVQTELKVANQILNIAFDVQGIYYRLQAEQTKLDLMQPLVDLTKAASELSAAQKDQGNINELEFQEQLNEFLEAKILFSKSQIEIVRLKEKMMQLLGLSSIHCWSVPSELPSHPKEEFSLSCLEEIALSERLDLKILIWEIERLARTFGIKQWWAYTDAYLGGSYEKDPEGFKVGGVAFAFALPLFNYGQADCARLRALFMQNVHLYQAKKIEILTEIRSVYEQLKIQRSLVLDYETKILPLQKQILSISQNYYHSMAMSVYRYLHAKKQELYMQIRYTEELRDYWLTKVAMYKALGIMRDFK